MRLAAGLTALASALLEAALITSSEITTSEFLLVNFLVAVCAACGAWVWVMTSD